jgi:ferredoxin
VAARREIRIDRDLCMGSGQCCWYAPSTFDQDDETIAIVIDSQGDPAEAIRKAAGSCPAGAISIVTPAEEPRSAQRDSGVVAPASRDKNSLDSGYR